MAVTEPEPDADPASRLATLVGAPVLDLVAPYVAIASADAIRRFARAYGDDNPLYSDPAYAAASVRAGLVAPPLFPLATGAPQRSEGRSGWVELDRVPGTIGPTIVSERWLLTRQIPEGARLQRARFLHQVSAPDGPDRETFDVTERTLYTQGPRYALRDRVRRYRVMNVEPSDRGAARQSLASPGVRERTRYGAEALAQVDAVYGHWARRGARTLYAEEVAPGTRLGPMAKGPLTVTDLVEYRAGVGPGPLGGEALALAYRNRQRRPDLYAPDEWGVPDIIERRHFDDAFARSLGMPGATDYSHTRLTWLSHLLTDWMGDGGWVLELSGTTALGENYAGDTHLIEGEVVEVGTDGPVGVVRISLAGRNQLGQVTCRADAVVLLPKHPAVVVSADDLAAVAEETTDGGRS